MLPELPREFLWTNLETMDEFFKLEPVNIDFFETFQAIKDNPFMVKPDAVKVFNEVYYQLTRITYEHPIPSDIPQYFSDAKANLGWNYSAELVFTMVYFLLKLSKTHSKSVNNFFINGIWMRNQSCYYWQYFNTLYTKLEIDNKTVSYTFKPHPIAVEYLKAVGYVNWIGITNQYHLSSVDHVINLWGIKKDKSSVASMILENALGLEHFRNNSSDADQLCRYLKQYIQEDKRKRPEEMAEFMVKESALQTRIRTLEFEIENLKTLLEDKRKATGKDRKFTLMQIVDYCKGCVTWDDTKSIVAMLNKMLRVGATQEDSDLVDSIETEFKNRLHGNTTIQGDYYAGDKVHEKNVIPNVGNYKPRINTQTVGMPAPAIGKQDPNLLQNE